MKEFHFTVAGTAPFPIDALRYDGCWPFQATDSKEIEASLTVPVPTFRTVRLASNKKPTPEVWLRHGWIVS